MERSIIEELRYREPAFHQPDLCGTRELLESYTAPEFWEISASGKMYTRDYVIDTVEARFRDDTEPDKSTWEIQEFLVTQLGPDIYMTRYLLAQGYRDTRRLGIWRKKDESWEILYHQGTIIRETLEVKEN